MATNYGSYSWPSAGAASANPSVGTNGSTAPTSSTEVGGINPSGNLQPLQTDANGNLLVSTIDDNGSGGTATFTGTGQFLQLTTNGASTLTFLPSGTWSGLIGVFGSTDGVNFSTNVLPLYDINSQTSQSFVASNLTEICQIGGFKVVRVQAISTWTGTAVVMAWLNSGVNATTVISPNAAGFFATANLRDGSGNAISSTSGALNVDVTQPLPAGTNVIGHVINDAGSAIIGKVGIDQTTPGTTNGVQVNAALPAGTNVIGHVIVDSNVGPTDATASGNITTQNLNPNSGVATAASTVAVTSLAGQTSWSVQVTGTYTGALTPQVTVDGSNWIALSATSITNINTNAQAATIASAAVGIFEISAPPCAQLRISANAAVTGTAVVTIRVSSSTTRLGLDSPIPAGTAIIGALSANQSTNVAQINGVTPLMGNGVSGTGSLRVNIASDTSTNTNAFSVKETTSGTVTNSNVASSATSVTILASNASRLGATVFNDSTAVLYLNLAGNAASTTNYTVQLVSNAYYELPPAHIYTGAITGIWASANGNARVCELT
jgi:hypothetical protein